MKRIDLKALAKEAFGYSPLQRFAEPEPLGPKDTPVAHPAAAELHGGAGRGLLGLPAFCRVTFQPTRTAREGFAGMDLIDPILTVGQPQTIISTPITGRSGTVKEYIGQGDFAVTIKGILATDPFSEDRFAYPLSQVQLMLQMAALGVALPVQGWLLDVYNIKNLVIQNASFPELPGFTNLQAYELQCLSDEPIELTL